MVVNKSMLNSEMDVSMPMVAYFKRSTKPHPKAPVGVSPSECHTRELVENFLYVYTCMDVSYMYVIQYVLLNCFNRIAMNSSFCCPDMLSLMNEYQDICLLSEKYYHNSFLVKNQMLAHHFAVTKWYRC